MGYKNMNRPNTITERIEDYLSNMEGKISRKAHLVRIFLNKKDYREFKEELTGYWSSTLAASFTKANPARELYSFMGYVIEVVEAHEESIVVELRDEYKTTIQSNR